MCTPADKCFEKLADLAFGEAIKAWKYVRDYNDNLQQLQVKSRDLGDCMEIITRKVSVADAYSEVIEVNVLQWQKDANTLKDDIQQLFSIKASIPCIAFSCPNISRRHKFSKRAEEKMPNVDDLITKYNNFKDHISHPGTHYTENLKKLQEKLEDLGDCTKIIKRKVLAAKGRGDEIEVDVLRWQIDAANLKDGIDQLIRENTTKASDIEQLIRESTTEARICSTECPCPDVMWQYKFGKQAVEKIADADGLIMKYNNFKDQISHTGSHYMDNLQKLQVRLRDLGDCMDKIKGKVSEANDRGHEIEVNVSHWQTDADSLKDGIEQLIRGSTAKASICSTECPFPENMWQYEFSKHAEDKIADADELIIKYNNFKDSISHPKARPPEFLSDTNYVNFDSRVSILKNIMDALRKSDVNKIGVFGPGGVGKTTLVKEVGEQMRKDEIFNHVAIATVSANLDVKEVQTRLAASLNFKFEASMDDQVGRATELSNKFLNGDNYLVILDDIWEEVKMEAIGIPCTNGKKGCKVVLTSRNENLLSTVMEVDRNFPMETLSSAEAWTLFAKTLFTMNAGNSNQSQQKMNSLAYKVCDPPKENSLEYEVCERCQGLPVAIVALGKALKGKQEHAWTTALQKMKKYMLTEVEDIDRSGLAGLASLKVSYEMLRTADAKSCFLLCCFFAEDAEIQLDELTRICMARSLLAQNPGTLEEARNVVRTVLDVLKSASLLSNGSDEDAVRIHDVIRDAGIKIARDQGESFLIDHGVFQWPRDPPNGPSYSAISLIFKNINELPDGLVYPKLHTLMIENSKLSNVQFPNDFFAGMTQLTVLTITRMRMQQLPSSLAKLTKLRMLYLHECELADISMLKDLKKNLEVLSLQGSDHIEALPLEIGELTNLRVFDLRSCQNFKVIPRDVIFKLKNLEELYFALEFDKWEGTITEQGDTSSRDNVSLEELNGLLKDGQLTTLFIHIPAVMLLPKEDLIFANLKRFAISVGSPFDKWEVRKGEGKRLLKLEDIQLRNDVITLAEKADRLLFRGIKGLNRVLRNGTVGNKFLDLEYLKIVSCDCDREYFLGEPKSFEQSRGLHDLQPFNKLTWLTIEKFESKYLFSPTATRGLVHLENLQVESCKIMEGIVGFEGQNDANEIIGEVKFGKLKKLRLESLPNLISFYVKKEKMGTTMGSSSARAQPLFNEKVIFPVLEKLTIGDLGNIINIWDKQSIGVLEKQGSFGQLIKLYVRDCKKLMHVFPSSTHPLIKNLKNLLVFDCETMEGIIEVASPDLEHSADIQKQEVINKDIIMFRQLKSMTLYGLPKLKSFYNETQGFFSPEVAFPILEELNFRELCKITRIWDNQPLSEQEKQAKSFCELITLRVEWCVNLEFVLPLYMLPQLKNLQKLYITSCLMMEVILSNNRKDLALLPNIRSLSTDTQLSFSNKVASSTLKQLVEIQEKEGINNDIIVFPQLKYVKLRELPELKSFYAETEGFFSHKVAFPVLEMLILINVCNITRIWDGQALSESEKEAKSFCKLTHIFVHNCVNLEYALPLYMLPLLKNLQKLYISRCLKMEVIISNNPTEKEAIKNDTIRCPELKTLQLYDFPNLKSLSTGYTQLCFSNKDAFPVLDKISVGNFGTNKEISIEDESSEKIDLQIIEFFGSGKEFQSVEGDSTAGNVLHRDAGCDGCDVYPIIGPRFKSTVKLDYDLCSVCFSIMGVATDYIRRDHPFDSFKRLCDPELDDDLEIPNEISMKQATKVWELFLKIFHYRKQSKEEYGTSGKVSDTSDEELDQDLKIFMDNISMKRANALWKIYFMIFRNGKQSEEECGTSGKEIDPNGEELNEDLEISTNKISMEDALTVLQKIFFENIQNMMEFKGECGTSSKGNGKESNHNGEELDEDLETLTNKISMEDAITVPGKIFENIRNGEESKEECGTGSKENDHNGEELNEDLETPTNEISMEDALTMLGKIFENIYRKESKEKCGTSGEESDQSCEES